MTQPLTTNFADKENVCRPQLSGALAIRGQVGNLRPGAVLDAFAEGRSCHKRITS